MVTNRVLNKSILEFHVKMANSAFFPQDTEELRHRSGIHRLLKIRGAGEYRFGRSGFSSRSSVRSGSGGAERRASERPLSIGN